jgi:hypothetical protein
LAVSLLAGTLFGGMAVAQQPTKPAPAKPEAAAPTPAHIEAARELVIASGISRSFAVVIPQLMDQLGTSLTQTRPDLIRDLNTVLEQLKPDFDKQTDQIIDSSARLYAGLMTEAEIKTALAFFNSDVGRKYVNVQPPFMANMLPLMQNWQQQVSSYIVTRVRAEMRKKGHEM